MGQLPILVNDNKFLRRITVRAYCVEEAAQSVALAIFVKMIEASSKFNLKIWNEYVDSDEAPFDNMYSQVSFTVLYKDEEDRDAFINLINTGEFL